MLRYDIIAEYNCVRNFILGSWDSFWTWLYTNKVFYVFLFWEKSHYFSASLSNIGQLFGSVSMGIAMGSIGRKKTIMVFCIPLLIGWLIVGFSEKFGEKPKQVLAICVGRVFQGVGIMSSVTQTYLVEVADAERR